MNSVNHLASTFPQRQTFDASADDDIDRDYDRYRVVNWQPGVVASVAQAANLSEQRALKRDLPSFFKFPVNASTGTVIAPAFSFLAKRCLLRGNDETVANTIHAYAYDLRSFFQFLAMCGRAWDEADQIVFEEYVLDMSSEVLSAGRSLQLAQATIGRRVATVASFYKHARARGLTEIAFDPSPARAVGRSPDTLIRPIPPETLAKLLPMLGPPPSLREPGQSSRLWIASQLALVAGLRRMEVCHVALEAVLSIQVDDERPLDEHPLVLTRVKGRRRKSRTVLIPSWLVREMQLYADNERSELIATLDPSAVAPTLLVTSNRGGRAGRRLTPGALGRAFRKVAASASLNRQLPAFRYGAGTSDQPHTFHDLRHTCACLCFIAFEQLVEDPWGEVQRRLGHALVDTTKRVYLQHVHEFAPPADQIAQDFIRRMVTA
jgi:integrase